MTLRERPGVAFSQGQGPCVLAGLSAGAVVARLIAMSYPEEIAGLVLVDHAFLPDKKKKDDGPTVTTSDAADTPPAVISMTPVIVTPEDEPGFDPLPKQSRELDRWARSMNPDLATEETTRRCIAAVAKGSFHSIEISRPDVVIQAIREVIDAVKSHAPVSSRK